MEQHNNIDLLLTLQPHGWTSCLICDNDRRLQKIQVLLRNKSFSENRAKDFPYQEFHAFERIVKVFLNL